jgi:hypothetical protein
MSEAAADTMRRRFAIGVIAERHVDLYSRLLHAEAVA